MVLIGGHFLARFRYYGEWLPNTYYAKHVGPWYESGFRYLWAAAIETGLYLLIPLALVALRGRWREHRDGIYVLVLLLVGTHLAYLFEIGGDHFEYRPLDFYWPLLAVPAAEGVARLGGGLSRFAQAAGPRDSSGPDARTLAARSSFSYRSSSMPARFKACCSSKAVNCFTSQDRAVSSLRNSCLMNQNCRLVAGRAGHAGARGRIQ